MSDTLNLLDGLDVDIPVAPSDMQPGSSASTAQSGAFFGPYQLLQEVGVGGVARASAYPPRSAPREQSPRTCWTRDSQAAICIPGLAA